MKICKKCNGEIPDGKVCRPCANAYSREWQKRNRKKVNASHYKWIKKNPEKNLEVVNRWREKNKEHYNEYHKLYQRELKKKKLQDDKGLERDNNIQMEGNQSSPE